MGWWTGTDKQSKKQGKVAEEVTHVIRSLVKINHENNNTQFHTPKSDIQRQTNTKNTTQ